MESANQRQERTRLLLLLHQVMNKKRQSKQKKLNFDGRANNSFELFKKRMSRKKRMQLLLPLTIHFRERHVWMFPKSDEWFTMADELFDEQRWYANFRVSRRTFQYILNSIENEISRKNTRLRESISARRRLALTLYFLASTSEYRTISNLFGVSTAFVCICVKEVCHAIVQLLRSSHVFFPKNDEISDIIKLYREKWGFPMCCGAIDGTHIPIVAPKQNPADYINRKKYHSIVMQAVVDSSYLFRDFVVGWPGSVHDARVLSNSKLYELGLQGNLFGENISEKINGVTVNPMILGDAAYPLLPWLMKPYQHVPNMPFPHKYFNYRLSRARMTVENTFGRWKGRFRRFLKKVDMKVENVTIAVAASCIIHNLCVLSKEEVLDEWLADVEAETQDVQPVQEPHLNQNSYHIRNVLTGFFMTDPLPN